MLSADGRVALQGRLGQPDAGRSSVARLRRAEQTVCERGQPVGWPRTDRWLHCPSGTTCAASLVQARSGAVARRRLRLGMPKVVWAMPHPASLNAFALRRAAALPPRYQDFRPDVPVHHLEDRVPPPEADVVAVVLRPGGRNLAARQARDDRGGRLHVGEAGRGPGHWQWPYGLDHFVGSLLRHEVSVGDSRVTRVGCPRGLQLDGSKPRAAPQSCRRDRHRHPPMAVGLAGRPGRACLRQTLGPVAGGRNGAIANYGSR